jgi:hypothetical protein
MTIDETIEELRRQVTELRARYARVQADRREDRRVARRADAARPVPPGDDDEAHPIRA